MKVLVFSDSHGSCAGMVARIEAEQPDAVIHLGDYTGDARDLERSYQSLPIYHIRGNNDYEFHIPLSAVIRPAGVPIYITHGHKERVSGLSDGMVRQRAAEQGAVLALYGHTHRMALSQEDGIWVMNPGSISLPRGGPESYGRLTLSDGILERLELVDEDGRALKVCRAAE